MMHAQIDYQARQAAEASIRSALAATHPHLVSQGDGLIKAAKNVRIELKAAFPGVKFSVKTSRFSGGDDLRISWTDGPNAKQVEEIADKYSAGTFDGMTDCYNYEHSAWADTFGDAKYVFCNRHYSDAALQQVITAVCTRLGGLESFPTVDDYRMGRIWGMQTSGGCAVDRELGNALADIAWPQ